MDSRSGSSDPYLMGTAAMTLLVVFGSFLALGAIAWRWGADTRESREWQWTDDRHA